MKSMYKDVGWTVLVDGFSCGTSFQRDGAFGFDRLANEHPKSHVVEYRVSALMIDNGSGEPYLDYSKPVRVKCRELKKNNNVSI